MMQRLFCILVLCCITNASASAQTWPAGIHDPSSIVKCDDTYWVFGTGDGIFSMYSKDLITWESGPTPFTKTEFPAWINNYVNGATDADGNPVFHGGFWAPDIIFMNNRYYLYYSCSEWGTMTSTIGCVTNKTLNPSDPDYEWVDAGFLGIWSYQPGLALNAIDPSITRGPDGRIWMVYGSFNEQGIVVTELDSITGKPLSYAGNLPGKSIANSWTGPQSYNYGEGEGACMIYRDGFYYLFYNKGGCCAGIASTYYMVMGRSASPTGPFYDKQGKPMRTVGTPSGGTVVLKHDDARGVEDRYFGPGHFGLYTEGGVDYVTFHYYDPNGFYPNPDANNQGRPTLGIGKLTWEEDGWPAVSLGFMEDGVYTLENAMSQKVVDVASHNIAEGALMVQMDADTLFDTQKWIFHALGTGEYTIQNYADPSWYVSAGEGSAPADIVIKQEYKDTVSRKFRTFTSPGGNTIIYPTVMDKAISLYIPTSLNVKLSLGTVTSQDYLKWIPHRFEETMEVSENTLTVDFRDGKDSSIIVQSNGRWSARVFNASWLIVESPGNDTGRLKLSFLENSGETTRTSRVYVSTYGGITETITVVQEGWQDTTSAGNAHMKPGFRCYPNPAGEELIVDCSTGGRLTVFSQTGQKLSETLMSPGSNRLDVASWEQGIYLLHLQTGDAVYSRKIIRK